jgi:predicted nucleic acid-binding protein
VCLSRWHTKNLSITARLEALGRDFPDATLFVSVISIGEIATGHASKFNKDPVNQADFRKWLKEKFAGRDLPVDSTDAEVYGAFRAKLFDMYPFEGKKKRPERCKDVKGDLLQIDENDLWLVGQAANRKLTLLTADKMSKLRDVFGSDVAIVYWPPDDPHAAEIRSPAAQAQP